MSIEVDCLVVGAGVSGICCAYHIKSKCPGKSFTILEARHSMGGTWDYFKYPGLRSDSDMYTFGYSFKPWSSRKAIADGPSILSYVKETAATFGLDKSIQYGVSVKRAYWSSKLAQWRVEAQLGDETVMYKCKFLFMSTGYYNYAGGFMPEFEGASSFEGPIIHAQQWPEDLDYSNKNVVVIGSGATAVTIVPVMAETTKHITMLQRSPTYIVASPAEIWFANLINSLLPSDIAGAINKWIHVLGAIFIYWFSKTFPVMTKKEIRRGVKAQLGKSFDVDKHFSPKYNPWDQRICLAPDGDFFKALRRGKSSVVTDTITRFTPKGIELASGQTLEADIVVCATGLRLQLLSGIEFYSDDEKLDLSKSFIYKGMMISRLPNLTFMVGYTNASWTLKIDLACQHMCRILNHMDAKGYASVVPEADPDMKSEPALDFTSTYVTRSVAEFPKQGPKSPWKLYQNYLFDMLEMRFGSITNPALRFK